MTPSSGTPIGFLPWSALIAFAWCLATQRSSVAFLGALAGILAWHLFGLDFLRLAYDGEAANAWIVLAIVAAVPFVVGLALARYAFRGRHWPMAVELPLVWVTMEYARMYFVAIFTEVSFPYLQIGSLVDAQRLMQTADLGGVWTLSWLVAAANGAIYDALSLGWARWTRNSMPRHAIAGVVVGVVTLVVASTYGGWRLSQSPGKDGPLVALVPGAIGRDKDAVQAEEFAASLRAMFNGESPDLLVWAEGASAFPVVTEFIVGEDADAKHSSSVIPSGGDQRACWKPDASMTKLGELSRRLGSAILVGCDRQESTPGDPLGRLYNSLALATPQDGFCGSYDKSYLVPWRECRPVVALTLGLLPTPASDATYAGPYRAGRVTSTLAIRDGETTFHVGSAICFEVAYASLHRQWMNSSVPPDFLVGAANEGAFRGSQYARISFDAQRMRAIECRRGYARVANQGISAIVDGNGQVIARAEMTVDSKPLVAHVPLDDRRSLYVVWGDWLPIGCCLAIAVLSLSQVLSRSPVVASERAAPATDSI